MKTFTKRRQQQTSVINDCNSHHLTKKQRCTKLRTENNPYNSQMKTNSNILQGSQITISNTVYLLVLWEEFERAICCPNQPISLKGCMIMMIYGLC